MDATWIVSANASRARIFAQTGSKEPLEEIHDMVNEAGRMRTEELERDKVGPRAATKSKHNVGAPTPNKSYQPAQTAEQHEAELFARSVTGFLLQGYQEGRFRHLGLVASPEFLGVLRKLLDPKLQSVMNLEINKDYTQLSGQQLLEQVQAHKEKG